MRMAEYIEREAVLNYIHKKGEENFAVSPLLTFGYAQIETFVKSLQSADVQPVKWISVTEKLPEKYHQVLCYGSHGLSIDYYSGEKSVCGNPLFMVGEAKITHWMPLPEPPKDGET